MKFGGAALGGGLLAGCVSRSGGNATPAGTDGSDGSGTNDPASSSDDGSYAGRMAPVGTLELDAEPQSVVGGWGFEADVVTALGQADKLVASEGPQFWFTGFYDKLPGVSVPDPDSLDRVVTDDWSLRKEFLYELDPDVLATDPNRFVSYYGSDESEVAEIHDNLAPFFGNASRRKRGEGWSTWPGEESYPTTPSRCSSAATATCSGCRSGRRPSTSSIGRRSTRCARGCRRSPSGRPSVC